MKIIETFEGNQLTKYSEHKVKNPVCSFFGKDCDNNSTFVPLNNDLLGKHILFIGGIGTGKTNAFTQIISQLRNRIENNDVAVIFDTKGEFYDMFYRPGDIVISSDETSTGENGIDYWNIFNEIENNKHMEENIVEISKALFHDRLEKTSQPFFPNAAKDLFGAILTHFTRNKGTEQMNNEMLRSFLDSSSASDIREMLSQHEDMKAMISYISDDRSPQTQGVISELQNLSREIFIGNFKKSGSLSIQNAVRSKGGKFIFIKYDITIGKMLSPIYTLIFDLAIKEALRNKSQSETKGNVYFIADEFRLLPNLQHIDDAVNFGRSLGVKFMIGIQNIQQVFEAYGEQKARSLLSGFLTSVAFRVNDITSRDYIKELHGKNRKKDIYRSVVQTKGVIEDIHEAYVIEDWDISNLEIGQAIIGLPGEQPFLFRFNRV